VSWISSIGTSNYGVKRSTLVVVLRPIGKNTAGGE
jgi:hypothetical protein